VVLEVTLVAVRNSNGFELGIELGGSGTGVGDAKTETIGFTHYGIGNVDPATGSIRLPDPALFGLNWAIFNSGDFSFILNAIKSVGETRITSSPKILIEDNALARLSQLSQEPYETSSQGETSTITSFGGFVDAGTVLNIIPHVSDQDWLRLEYQIQFSSFSARTAQQLAANLPPPRQENNINGTVRVPAEHTVVLGGLVSTRNDKTIEGIPWISDIPILGELFTNRSNDKQDETLFIFISPVVLRDPEFQDLLSLSHEDMKKAQLYQQRELTNPLKMFDPDFDMRQGEIQ
jgi:type II secretory pathway component GspD/PulD (secretin)